MLADVVLPARFPRDQGEFVCFFLSFFEPCRGLSGEIILSPYLGIDSLPLSYTLTSLIAGNANFSLSSNSLWDSRLFLPAEEDQLRKEFSLSHPLRPSSESAWALHYGAV